MTSARNRKGTIVNPLRLAVALVVILTLQALATSDRVSQLFVVTTNFHASPSIGAQVRAPILLQQTPLCQQQYPLSCVLPLWMQNYFRWHNEQLNNITLPSDWTRTRLLVVRCLSEDRCGGTADRLKGLPLYLALAAKTKRLLFLRWSRPFALEAFMIPYQLNWTVPDALTPLLDSGNGTRGRRNQFGPLMRVAQDPGMWLVEGSAQMAGFGFFQEIVSDLEPTTSANPSEFFHDMFLALFRPAPDLQRLVESLMQMLNLQPNQFVTAHVRAKYPGEPYRETWNMTLLRMAVRNAVDCASSLAPTMPVYVAGDTLRALQVAQEYGIHTASYPVVSHLDVDLFPREDPPHLNFARKENAAEFFSIFADLFIMSQSRCVAYGAGGFGLFGSLASFNASCKIAHSRQGVLNNCTKKLRNEQADSVNSNR